MQILWLAPYPPEAPLHGGRIRLAHLLAGTLSSGHRVDLLCIGDGAGPSEPATDLDAERLTITRFGGRERAGAVSKLRAGISPLPEAAWLVASEGIAAALDRLEPGRYDLAVLEQAHMGAYLPALSRASLPVVLDAQNLEGWLTRQLGRRAERQRARLRLAFDARKFDRLERRLFAAVETTVATSAPDRNRIIAASPGTRVEVITSGVDLDRFTWSDHREPAGSGLLMTGTLGYPPNLDAALWMHREILPRIRALSPGASLSLVGHAPTSELSGLDDPAAGFRVVGRVDDVIPYMRAADVFVIPLRMGSGTRLKAVEGLGLVDGHDVLIADEPEAFARCVHRALTDRELRQSLSAAGRSTVEERFDWHELGTRFAGVLESAARE